MTETSSTEAVPAAPAQASPKKTKASGAGKSATKRKASAKSASHPPTAKMVVSAITALKERGGSSVKAIKKYISSTYKTDAEKLAPFIKRYLKSSVAAGTLLQTKGKGASGSFKLAKSKGGDSDDKPKAAAPRKKKAASAGKPKTEKSPAKKTGTKKPKAKKATASGATKVKKAAKTPTKPKVPKPKKAAGSAKGTTVKKTAKKPAAKKASAKK